MLVPAFIRADAPLAVFLEKKRHVEGIDFLFRPRDTECQDILQHIQYRVLRYSGNTWCWVAIDGQDHRGRGHYADGSNTFKS